MQSEVYIFGAGTNGELCLKTCHEHGVTVAGILDNYSDRPNLNGAMVIRPDQADRDVPVVVTSPTAAVDIMLQLEGLGFDKIMNLSQFRQELGFEPEWYGDIIQHRPEYRWLRGQLEDDESRSVFDAVVKFRKTLEIAQLAAVQTSLREQWFDPEFFVPGPHVFVDGGAYDGDTAAEFIRQCPNYNYIHLFEPSAVLAEEANMRLQHQTNIQIWPVGLSDKQEKGILENAGLPSGTIGGKGEEIGLVTLDSIGFAYSPTFIKLDVEGCEKAAILGAEQTIRKHRPMLAIAVYHRPEDLWEIPQILHNFGLGYKFYLRHYTQFYHETVLYCI